MTYKALYREWRPADFDDVVEQEHVTRTLKNAVKTGRIAHAYLFCGTRGTGKTSMANIFSRAVNCLNPRDGNPCNKCEICKGILDGSIMDVIEMDAASNNSVENIRNIREEVAYSPAMTKYKVYIIDEVHMLSTGAFNALLKTLEEPPSHVIFILATTEPHKLPATVLSRCQRFDFRRISAEGIIERLYMIAEAKNVKITERAATIMARVADGALRDAISLLDQCISGGGDEIDVDDVLESAGILHDEAAADLADALYEKDINMVIRITDSVLMQGKSTSQFISSLIYYFRNLLICSGIDDPGMFIESSDEIIERMKSQAGRMGRDIIVYVIKELSIAEGMVRRAAQPRTYLEIALINIASLNMSFPEQASVLERIAALENKVNRFKSPAVEPAVGRDAYIKREVTKKPEKKEAKEEADKDTAVGKEPVEKAKTRTEPGKRVDMAKLTEHLKNRGHVDIYPYLTGAKGSIENNVFVITLEKELFRNIIVKNRNSTALIKEAVDELYEGDYEIKIYGSNNAEGEKDDFEEKAKKAAEAIGIELKVE
jgi:DNA polymerase-3 subunit gamma/tau